MARGSPGRKFFNVKDPGSRKLCPGRQPHLQIREQILAVTVTGMFGADHLTRLWTHMKVVRDTAPVWNSGTLYCPEQVVLQVFVINPRTKDVVLKIEIK